MAANPKSKRYPKDWRKKEINSAKLKYSRDYILSLFQPSELPLLKISEDLLSSSCLSPILTSALKTQCENSRKSAKTLKREKPAFKIEISQIRPEDNPESEDPTCSHMVSQTDSKREVQETYVKYPEDLFLSHVSAKNPFANLISLNSAKKSAFVYPLNKSFERIWFYKDSLNRVQGPFSSVEMFNWTAAGYFTSHLMVAKGDANQFYALSCYC